MEELKFYAELVDLRKQIADGLERNRESSLVLTKLDEAKMWLNQYYSDYFAREDNENKEKGKNK